MLLFYDIDGFRYLQYYLSQVVYLYLT